MSPISYWDPIAVCPRLQVYYVFTHKSSISYWDPPTVCPRLEVCYVLTHKSTISYWNPAAVCPRLKVYVSFTGGPRLECWLRMVCKLVSALHIQAWTSSQSLNVMSSIAWYGSGQDTRTGGLYRIHLSVHPHV